MTLWFVVPAHGRLELARICLGQLRRTCDALTKEGIEASAVVIACDENLDTARDFGFGTVVRNNTFLSRRYNDGFQFACDPRYNSRPVDYVVPCGSDDWLDHRIFLELPPRDTVYCFQRLSFVREDGRELRAAQVTYTGGCGIRIYPRQIIEQMEYRPADEDRRRGCDMSILTNLYREKVRLRVAYRETSPLQIVDWKSPSEQLNSYERLGQWMRGRAIADPFQELAGVFPAEALAEMREHYSC